jgi:hypothetical protein
MYCVWKVTESLCRAKYYFDRPRHEWEVKMSTIRRPANYAGLLPVTSSAEPPILSTTFENDRRNGQPSLRKRASHALFRFLIAFCIGVTATLAWQWYGDAAREMIAKSYPQLGWLAPRPLSTVQNAPDMSGLVVPAAPFDQQQLSASLDAMRQSIDRLVAGHELILRSIDEITTRLTADYDQMTHNTDPAATNVTAGQKQIAGGINQAATNSAQAPPAKASGITVESRTDGASLRPTERFDIKPTEARAPQALPERGKQLSAASVGHDASCFPSASAVLQNHPGGWPTWTMRAPGHEGTLCWYAAARPRTSNHRRELMPGEKEILRTEDAVSAPPASYTRAPE